ncbi:scavenger receptor cysteine-rich type 1 protein M130-like isoform X1 [Sphaeramia orbicularis]|nr:scavenger receptor cysteine-rich type 1 protein M130-like isoform X1 [Sphaeramia orbicularis]
MDVGGNVNISVEGVYGGVCADSWTEEKSEKLCQEWGCGRDVPRATKPKRDFEVKFKSVHMVEEDGSLSKCSYVKNDGSCDPAYVVCSGSLKPRLKSSDYCSGKVEVNYENQWRPVCGGALKDPNTQNLFCRTLGCGEAARSTDYERSNSMAISAMTCKNLTQHNDLKECKASLEQKACTSTSLQCSNSKKMALAAGNACSGFVVVHSEGKQAQVSYQGWSKLEGEKLCKDLDCGRLVKVGPNDTIAGSEFWSNTFNCTGVEDEENIWACEKPVPPSKKELLYIECKGEPTVQLKKKCHGSLTIDGMEVCDTSWDTTYSAKVCQQLKYSNAIPGKANNSPAIGGKNYLHVHCEEHHHKIGQCNRFKEPCSGRLVSVYCTKNVSFTTAERCGGQIEVRYDTEYGGKVCYDEELTLEYKERFCEQLKGCGKPIDTPKETKTEPFPKDISEWTTVLSCPAGQKDFRYCLSRESCSDKTPAKIYCDGYKPRVIIKKEPFKVNVLAIVLGLGLFLILAIVIFIFVRVYIIRKSFKTFPPGFPLRHDVERDSGEFEELHSKEMENTGSGGIRSESEVLTENDKRSLSSYDDIDKVSELEPLTSRPSTTEDPHDSGVQDNKLEQITKEDGETYEVDDPQENYDDIEADLEPTQTTAEVHDSPRNAPECSTNTPPDLVLGDDGYLVPGQDE